MFPSSKRLDAPVLCSFQEAPLASSVGKLPVPSYPMLLFFKQWYILSLLQLHVLGSEDSPAASPLSPLHILKNFVTSISAPAYFSSLECSYLQPKTETPLGQSLLQSQTVWNSKLQPKDALFVVDMTTFLMKNQKHCVLLSRYIPKLGLNMGV